MSFLSLVLAVVTAAPTDASPAERRVAVIVGSNRAAPGRAELRYAHADARAMAEVLSTAGQFRPDDVVVLLDPAPEAVLAALDAAREKLAGPHTMLLFYYSGHADDSSLYPGGAPLSLQSLKERLADERVAVRVGVIDSCRGGGWTQAKGLAPAAPFAVGLPALSSEGTALLASSSGLEDAHEAESLQGSFFTHHLVAGLRGAADQTGDGQVTLSEAFAYANRLTIRDSATRAPMPQHPSFDLRLRGRQDVVLTSVGSSPTLLTLAQHEGPLQVVQLSSGLVVLEAPSGEQVLRVALPPGTYVVRRVTGHQVLSREVQVKEGAPTTVEEASLTLVGEPGMASKGGPLVGRHQLTVAAGVLPDAFAISWAVQGAYTWRFSSRFAVRARALYGAPTRTGLSTQLDRDFGVLPSAISAVRYVFGADFVWLVAAEPRDAGGGMTLALAVGGSAVGRTEGGFIGPASGTQVVESAPHFMPALTATGTVAYHLTSLPALAIEATLSGHAGPSSGNGGLWGGAQVGLGLSWHFL